MPRTRKHTELPIAPLDIRVAGAVVRSVRFNEQRKEELAKLRKLRDEAATQEIKYFNMRKRLESQLLALGDPYMLSMQSEVTLDIKCEPLDQQQLEALRGLVGKKEE